MLRRDNNANSSALATNSRAVKVAAKLKTLPASLMINSLAIAVNNTCPLFTGFDYGCSSETRATTPIGIPPPSTTF